MQSATLHNSIYFLVFFLAIPLLAACSNGDAESDGELGAIDAFLLSPEDAAALSGKADNAASRSPAGGVSASSAEQSAANEYPYERYAALREQIRRERASESSEERAARRAHEKQTAGQFPNFRALFAAALADRTEQ